MQECKEVCDVKDTDTPLKEFSGQVEMFGLKLISLENVSLI